MIITDEAVRAGAMALSEHITGCEWAEIDGPEAHRWVVETRAALQAAGPLLIAAELRAQATKLALTGLTASGQAIDGDGSQEEVELSWERARAFDEAADRLHDRANELDGGA